jgi:hypothetical protein
MKTTMNPSTGRSTARRLLSEFWQCVVVDMVNFFISDVLEFFSFLPLTSRFSDDSDLDLFI